MVFQLKFMNPIDIYYYHELEKPYKGSRRGRFPSLAREVYSRSEVFFRIRIGQHLVDAYPTMLWATSGFFDAILSEGGGLEGIHILKDEVVDYDGLVYVWSYMNGVCNDDGSVTYPMSLTSMLKCWEYINYFQVAFGTEFMDGYIHDLLNLVPLDGLNDVSRRMLLDIINKTVDVEVSMDPLVISVMGYLRRQSV